MPRRGLGETSLAILGAGGHAVEQAAARHGARRRRITDLRPNVREAFRDFAAFIDGLAQRAGRLAPAEVLEQLIAAIDYEAVLHAEGPEGADRWENVRELVASAANWSEEVTEEASGTPLERFLAEAALLSSADTVVGNEEGVTLMTLHTAKGLEWPVVVLTGLEHGLFPLARAEEQPDGSRRSGGSATSGSPGPRTSSISPGRGPAAAGGELRPGIPSRFLQRAAAGDRRGAADDVALGAGLGRRSGGRRASGPADGRSAASRGHRITPAARPPAVRPSEEEPSQDTPRYVKGERVRHRRFGSGTIQGLTGAGRDLKVSVAFDDDEVGVKQLLVAYAGLEREWESA